MSKLTGKQLLFLLFNFIYSVNILILAQQYIPRYCVPDSNYTTNSTFQINLDRTLANLPTTNSGYGFFNSSSGQYPDTANAIALCRGDTEPIKCGGCVKSSIVSLRQFCPNQKEAIVYFQNCMVKYSNDDILGKTNENFPIEDSSSANVTDPDGFNQNVLILMANLTSKAADGELLKYATGTTTLPNSKIIYGLVQCIPILSNEQCTDCLKDAVSRMVSCCGGRVFTYMKVILSRCNIRYEDYRFYDEVAVSPSGLSPPPRLQPSMPGRNKKTSGSKLLIAALSAGVGTIFVVIIILCFIRKLKWRRKTNNHVNVEIFLKNHEFRAPKRYSYLQVKKMTNSFKVKLGQGAFGNVYRGELRNGNLVAVKVLNELKGNGEDFINEVASVGHTSHVNIVSLVGFCCDGDQRALIYEFMPNGSLERFIYGRESSSDRQLGWEKLHQIAVGIARGLEYLHSGCNTRILHFDIKPHNILLDHDFCPKISDFGLAKLFPEKRSMISMSHMRGTPGYIAPEQIFRNVGQVSHKSDVYSYGKLILEMVGGRKKIEVEVDHSSEIYFPYWIHNKIELHDEQLGLHGIMGEEENEMVRKMIIVGLWCIQTNPLSRPTITKVLEMLEDDLASLEIPPKPFINSSSSRSSPSKD